MAVWLTFVEVFRELLFVLAHVLGGSLGSAIVALSMAVRVALLPLTLRLALQARELQEKVRKAQPEMARLRERYADDPAGFLRATRALHRRHGIRMLPSGAALNVAIQLPLGGGLYQAISGGVGRGGRFLWIADLARPDVVLAVVAAALASLAATLAPPAAGGPSGAARGAAIVAGIITLVFAWRLAAGVGLYWGASNVVGVAQSLILRRLVRRAGAA